MTGYHRKALIRLLGPIRPVDRGDVVVGPVAMVLGWPRPSRLHGRRQTASARKGFSPSFLS